LLSESKIFEDEILTATEGTDHPAEEVPKAWGHGSKYYRKYRAATYFQVVHFRSAQSVDEGQQSMIRETWKLVALATTSVLSLSIASLREHRSY
jgi:hypothetical protein